MLRVKLSQNISEIYKSVSSGTLFTRNLFAVSCGSIQRNSQSTVFATSISSKEFCWSNKTVLSLLCLRNYGTRANAMLTSKHAANQFVRWLLPEERTALLGALKEHEVETDGADMEDAHPSFKQLRLVAVSNAIPFIGFGFLDNGIMILAGEYIDHTIGMTLGISTMAAAAVGNIISDLAGLGLAGYVEAIAIKMGFDVPPLSTRQASMWKTKYSAYLGRGIGITIGCIIGMFPLLFIDGAEETETAKEYSDTELNKNFAENDLDSGDAR